MVNQNSIDRLRETFAFMTSSYRSGARRRYCAFVRFFVPACEVDLSPSFEIEWSGRGPVEANIISSPPQELVKEWVSRRHEQRRRSQVSQRD
jgi:hypothetical protein